MLYNKGDDSIVHCYEPCKKQYVGFIPPHCASLTSCED